VSKFSEFPNQQNLRIFTAVKIRLMRTYTVVLSIAITGPIFTAVKIVRRMRLGDGVHQARLHRRRPISNVEYPSRVWTAEWTCVEKLRGLISSLPSNDQAAARADSQVHSSAIRHHCVATLTRGRSLYRGKDSVALRSQHPHLDPGSHALRLRPGEVR
jgi:hypothetical protein